MKSRWLALAAAAAIVPAAARADDPPPAPVPAPPVPVAPAPAETTKHKNVISPEAQAAFDKMDKIANSPVRHGLEDASGTIGSEMMGMAMSMKFTFKAPSAIHVDPDPNLQGPMQQMGTQMTKGAERTLRSMLGIWRPSEEDEFDAEMKKADGGDVLVIVNFKGDTQEGRTEFALDANGLPSKGTSTTEMEMRGAKHEMKSEVNFTWTKVGDLYRLEKMEVSSQGMGGGMGGGGGRGGRGGGMGGPTKVTITPTYTDVGDFAIGTSWRTDIEGMGMAFESRISDLVVNGKKVEVKEPEAAKKPELPKLEKGEKPGEKEDGEDEDDEDDDGEDGMK